MRVQVFTPFRTLVIGMVIGLLIGSAGLVFSAMGKEGWDRQTAQFKLGYIVGSTDILRMVKRTTLPERIGLDFKIPRAAKPINWLYQIDRLFAEPKNKNRDIVQIIAFAGADMEKDFGGDISIVSGLEQLGKALKRRREAIISGEIAPTPPEILAKRHAAAEKAAAKTKCMHGCRKVCKDTCNAEIKEKFPPPTDAVDDGDPPKEKE